MATDLLTAHRDVRRALRDRMKQATSYPGQLRVDWEGDTNFEATADTEWWRERLVPASSQRNGIGPSTRVTHRGTYLLDVFRPAGKGSKALDLSVGSLLEVFKPGQELVHNERVVTIVTAYRSRPLVTGHWLQAPVVVEWYTQSYITI